MTRKVFSSATLATTAVLAFAGTALAEGPDRGMNRGRDGHPLFGILLMLAIAAAAIVGTWLVIRRGSTGSALTAPVAVPASPTTSAETILAERLARSEISADDYRSTLSALREGL